MMIQRMNKSFHEFKTIHPFCCRCGRRAARVLLLLQEGRDQLVMKRWGGDEEEEQLLLVQSVATFSTFLLCFT